MNNSNFEKYDRVLMQTAQLFAEQSKAEKLKVGAVLAKDGRVLITGYNGTVSGFSNVCEDKILVCPKCNKPIEVTEKNLRLEPSPIFTNDIVLACSNIGLGCHSTFKTTADLTEYFNANTSLKNIAMFHFPKLVKLKTRDFVLHAEQNVITYAAKRGIATDGCTLYITHSPCKECAKLIVQAGIVRVVYSNLYRDSSGLDFLKSAKVEVVQKQY
jgi:deoxycytidylate deaminase